MDEDINLSKKSCVCLDHGVFVEVALRLAEPGGFGKVYYVDPSWEEAFSKTDHAVIGDGFREITRVPEIWDVIEEVDCAVFCDVHHGAMQEYLERQGVPVWGARRADKMELKKLYFRELQKTLGMEVPKYDVVEGLDALREHCRAETDRWIKVTPQYRGMRETFHHKNYRSSRQKIDEMAVIFGGMQDHLKFLSEKPIKGKFEGGFDSYSVDSRLPKTVISGFERKDECYLAAVLAYLDLPEALKLPQAFLDELGKHRYRQMLSTEVKMQATDKGVLLEPTCRFPSPAGEEQMVCYENFPQIVWAGAHGQLLEPRSRCRYMCECMLEHNDDEEFPREITVPKTVREYVKLYNITALDGDRYQIAPGGKIIGAIVGIGDSPRESVTMLKHIKEALKDEPVTIKMESLGHLIKEIDKSQEAGIYFTDREMPTFDDLF